MAEKDNVPLEAKFSSEVISKAREILNRSEKEKVFRQQAVNVAFNQEGKVLLVDSQKAIKAGRDFEKTSLAQGGAEGDETGEEVAVKEIFEEMGMVVDPNNLSHVGEDYRQEFKDPERVCVEVTKGRPINGKEYKHFAFLTDGKVGEVDSEEIADYGWYTIEEADKKLQETGAKAKYEQQMRAIKEGYNKLFGQQ